MESDREIRMLQRLAGDADFQAWLKAKEEKELSNLVAQVDVAQIHRTQGQVLFVQSLRKATEAARHLPQR